MEILEITQVGALCSIQDSGRFGYRSFAIPQSGVLDAQMQLVANHLAGNAPDSPVLELIGGQFTAKCLTVVSVGISGIDTRVLVNGNQTNALETLQLRVNDMLEIQGPLAYLAISGELKADVHFQSYSSYALAGLGSSLFRKGDRIEGVLKETEVRRINRDLVPSRNPVEIIRICEGPEWETVQTTGVEQLNWNISKQSNRMGIRLEGEKLSVKSKEMLPVPTFPGTIQLPPDGQPIVLMNDAQTTGGYPRIGQVIKADLARLARLMLGGTIRFKFVTIEEARYIFQRQHAFIRNELQKNL